MFLLGRENATLLLLLVRSRGYKIYQSANLETFWIGKWVVPFSSDFEKKRSRFEADYNPENKSWFWFESHDDVFVLDELQRRRRRFGSRKTSSSSRHFICCFLRFLVKSPPPHLVKLLGAITHVIRFAGARLQSQIVSNFFLQMQRRIPFFVTQQTIAAAPFPTVGFDLLDFPISFSQLDCCSPWFPMTHDDDDFH